MWPMVEREQKWEKNCHVHFSHTGVIFGNKNLSGILLRKAKIFLFGIRKQKYIENTEKPWKSIKQSVDWSISGMAIEWSTGQLRDFF